MIAAAIGVGILLFSMLGAGRSLFSFERRVGVCVALAYLALCLAAQAYSGAWHAAFTVYPDEPSHFVGAVMTRDWLVSGPWFAPLKFAKSYYEHYPYFAVGYWPPLFNVVTGLWMLLIGVGRLQALLIPAIFAAGSGWLIFQFVRRRMGLVAGVCTGAVYLSLPTVQLWMCAVMVDHMTAFFCLASAAAVVGYLRRPSLSNGILSGVLAGCAILSKYSAAYLVALPLLAVLLTRSRLLWEPGFVVQPLLIAAMVGPWALWTHGLTFYGLPSERAALTAKRVGWFVFETFKIFPPVLLAIAVVGVIAVLATPKAWRDDLIVLGLLGVGHLTFLILSPVVPEQRYLLLPAAVFLITAFAGFEVLGLISQGWRESTRLSIGMAVATLLFVAFEFSHITRFPPDRLRSVVAFIVKDPARSGQRIVVPPTLEGPMIAEFAAQRGHRNYLLLRPIKTLAHSDWFGDHYSSRFDSPEKMMEHFEQERVNLILWDERAESSEFRPHARILGEILRRYPLFWRKVPWVDPGGDSESQVTIYEYQPQASQRMD